MKLKFNQDGLIPAIVQDKSGNVLMLAYMNQTSFDKTIETGQTWFYSRSRQELWHKGETSGNIQHIKKIVADCDYDTLLITVEQVGDGACHEGYKSCFHNPVEINQGNSESDSGTEIYSSQIIQQVYDVVVDRQNNPQEGSYTNYLLTKGIDKILKKVGEESAEVLIAAKNEDKAELIYEVSDLFYHLMVLLVDRGVTPTEIWKELNSRR